MKALSEYQTSLCLSAFKMTLSVTKNAHPVFCVTVPVRYADCTECTKKRRLREAVSLRVP